MLGIYRKILGHPFVYDQIRPRVVGGIDMRPLYELIPPNARRAILDVGCGTGDALKHLSGFDRYLGIDTDPVAIDAAKKRWGGDPRVRFECRLVDARDVAEIEPTAVVLSGVLHHLANDEAVGILRMAAASPKLACVVTNDIVFMPGMLFNNVLAMMDRGRYCRTPDAYAGLARDAGLDVAEAFALRSSPSNEKVQYHAMRLVPRTADAG